MATLASRGERARRDGQSKPKAPEAPSAPTAPSEDDIRSLAYRLYQRRTESGIAGDATADWIEAERVLSNHVPTARANEG